ncbi:MAG: hypothetical protein WCK42_06990 [Myxococcaceae bacterium]
MRHRRLVFICTTLLIAQTAFATEPTDPKKFGCSDTAKINLAMLSFMLGVPSLITGAILAADRASKKPMEPFCRPSETLRMLSSGYAPEYGYFLSTKGRTVPLCLNNCTNSTAAVRQASFKVDESALDEWEASERGFTAMAAVGGFMILASTAYGLARCLKK